MGGGGPFAIYIYREPDSYMVPAENRLGVEMIVELGSVVALAVFGYTIFWFVRRRRDTTRTALRELIKQMNKNKREQ